MCIRDSSWLPQTFSEISSASAALPSSASASSAHSPFFMLHTSVSFSSCKPALTYIIKACAGKVNENKRKRFLK